MNRPPLLSPALPTKKENPWSAERRAPPAPPGQSLRLLVHTRVPWLRPSCPISLQPLPGPCCSPGGLFKISSCHLSPLPDDRWPPCIGHHCISGHCHPALQGRVPAALCDHPGLPGGWRLSRLPQPQLPQPQPPLAPAAHHPQTCASRCPTNICPEAAFLPASPQLPQASLPSLPAASSSGHLSPLSARPRPGTENAEGDRRWVLWPRSCSSNCGVGGGRMSPEGVRGWGC